MAAMATVQQLISKKYGILESMSQWADKASPKGLEFAVNNIENVVTELETSKASTAAELKQNEDLMLHELVL